MEKTIHFKNARINSQTPCGLRPEITDENISIDTHKVTCLACVSLLATPVIKTKMTPIWEKRLKELQEKENGH